ncbi:hypothetical protein KC19_12G027200 [Ceratodon purpureus]|uniref:Protein kinase domain-containing protein n=1 Tax=Ceratodon purpureus TaxID=3225 RepID=A0A8T0G6Z2_CERPU|nr:hypothetical protein KC19_12G027200 [Ceratodon purpureus]
MLGHGSFGTVHKVRWLGVEVAMKTFQGSSTQDFLREVSILEGLRHPYILSLLWYKTDARKCQIIMELMDGDLYSLMQERMEECGNGGPPFSISEATHMMLQVAEGMLFLHEKKIVHRDLKSQNILVKRMKYKEVGFEHVHVKVADFGLSKTKARSTTYSNQTLNQGTTRWMAPELIRMSSAMDDLAVKHPFKVDAFSFGMVCFEILTGEVPFSGLRSYEIIQTVLRGGRPQLPDQIPDRLRYLIEACWSSEPSKRPRFDDICAELRHLSCAHFMTAETPELYLKLISTCMERITLFRISTSPKFHAEQCNYLVDKLANAVESARSAEDGARSLDILKLVF